MNPDVGNLNGIPRQIIPGMEIRHGVGWMRVCTTNMAVADPQSASAHHPQPMGVIEQHLRVVKGTEKSHGRPRFTNVFEGDDHLAFVRVLKILHLRKLKRGMFFFCVRTKIFDPVCNTNKRNNDFCEMYRGKTQCLRK